MFEKKQSSLDDRIETEINHLLDLMDQEVGYTDDYKSMAAQLAKLIELRPKEDNISKETWVTVGTHLAGLIILMNHERTHVIASKAFGLVKKLL